MDGDSRSSGRWILRCVARVENVDTPWGDTFWGSVATAFRICLVAQKVVGQRNGLHHVPRDFDHDLHIVSADRMAEAKYKSNLLRRYLRCVESSAKYLCLLACE